MRKKPEEICIEISGKVDCKKKLARSEEFREWEGTAWAAVTTQSAVSCRSRVDWEIEDHFNTQLNCVIVSGESQVA